MKVNTAIILINLAKAEKRFNGNKIQLFGLHYLPIWQNMSPNVRRLKSLNVFTKTLKSDIINNY